MEVSYQSITCLRWLGGGRCKEQNHTEGCLLGKPQVTANDA